MSRTGALIRKVARGQLPISGSRSGAGANPNAVGLASAKTLWSQSQRFSGPTTAGQAVTLFSDTGSGTIRSLWLAAASNFLSLDGRLQIFTDGASTPDVDIDIGTLFLCHNDANTQASGFSASTPHWHAESPGGAAIQTSGALFFPIYYSNGVTVKLLSPGGQTAIANGWYFQCVYQKGVTQPVRLRSIGRSWAGGSLTSRVLGGSVAPAAASAQALWDLAVSKPGWLVWVGFAEKGGAATAWTFLERDVQLTIDGEGTPSFRSSGTEDFFHGAFYYGNAGGGSNVHSVAGGAFWTPVSVATSVNTANYTANQGIDLLALCGGVLFNSECKADLLTEAAVTVPHTMTYVGLYYQGI